MRYGFPLWLGFPNSSLGKESTCNARFDSWVRKICWRRDRLPTPVFLGFPCGSTDKESAYNAGGLSSIPVLGRSPGEGKGCPLQDSGLENSKDCIVHRFAKNQTQLSDFHFHFLGAQTEKNLPAMQETEIRSLGQEDPLE